MPLDEPLATSNEQDQPARARPRLFFLLPLVAVLDIALALALGILVLKQEAKRNGPDTTIPSDPPSYDPIMISSPSSILSINDEDDTIVWERRKFILAVLAFSIARSASYAIIGINRQIRRLGVTVAAISILSTLFYVSIANLLLQARSKPDILDTVPFSWMSLTFTPHDWHWPHALRHVQPTMPILVGAQMAFTLFEWILYIAVVGVKIPPGANPVKAKRWARGLAHDQAYQRGVDSHSLYPSDGEDDANVPTTADSHQASKHLDSEDHDLKEAHAVVASPITNLSRKDGSEINDASERALLGPDSATPRTYGSTLTSPGPKTPQGPSHVYVASQGSVRSTRSPAAGMSRSTSARSGMYPRSPGVAELAGGAITQDDDGPEDDEEEDEEEAEGSDPDDIIDITPNRAIARKEARLRLARAALPERRVPGGTLSTLGMFGNDAPARNNGGRGNGVLSDEAGSPLGRNGRQDAHAPALLSVATSPEVPRTRQQTLAFDVIRHASMSILPRSSSSSTRSASTKGSSKAKFRLPKWMKPNKKK
ncbi:uncharacterized protein MEPE_01229 [Melanopsichium pennsylvanicum]|uniref:Uncharacterized protein n=2 Tax=Melanopsichium pennsylvanicum TaxID=63383 RepID=A0AAJ4XK15_9BASI|nr:uncharacterized protein MEPE_01229 [Melanopsichium pennsylvanicum]